MFVKVFKFPKGENMKKHFSLLALLGLFALLAQPAFSQCCPTCPQFIGAACPCPVQEVCAPVCPPKVVYQPKIVYQNSTCIEPIMTYQSKTIIEPVVSYQARTICQPKIVHQYRNVCTPRVVLQSKMLCPQPILGAAAPICCPQKRGFWGRFF